MNKTTRFFAITTVSLAILSVYLARALQVERARVAALQTAGGALAQSGSDAQREEHALIAGVSGNAGESEQASSYPTADVSESSEASGQGALPRRVRSRSHKEADLAYRRLEIQRAYPDLAAVLNFRPDEASRFIHLLAQQQLNDAEWEMSAEGSGHFTQAGRQSRAQANQAAQAALLGEARAADWSKYTNSLGSRAEIRELRMILADSDYPLRRDQYEPLVALIANEQIRHTRDREKLRSSLRDPANPTPKETIAYMDQRLDLIEESLTRRRRAAESVLDTEQLKRYQAMLELERARAQVDYESLVTLNAEAMQAKSTSRQ